MASNVSAQKQKFREALRSENMGTITEMIQTDPTFDSQYMLRYACLEGEFDIVDLLLQDPRVNPSIQDNIPIKYASERGFTNIVERLLRDPRVDPSAEKQYALKEACKKNHIETVNVLLRHPRVDPSVDDQMCIRNACMYGQTGIVRVLLQDPRVDPSVKGQACLHNAVTTRNIELVRLLLQDTRIDPSKDEQNIVKIAIEKGYVEILEILLQDPRVDPSIHDQHLLKDTIRKGKNSIVQTLLKDRRVDPSVDNQWALRTAIGSSDAQLLEILFTDDRVDPSFNNNFMIKNVATYGRTRLMKLFLKHPRVDPTVDNQYPLQIAVANGHVETVRELLTDERVDPSIRINEKEQGILSIAIDNGDPNMIKLLLLDPRVDPTVNYQFAIRQAVTKGFLHIVMVLLYDPRVDPMVAPPDQPSATVQACLDGNVDIITILLEDPRVNTNPTIFEMAKNGKFHHEINELVLSFQPDTPWEGFSKGDMEKFDSIFSEKANDYSCCPVCMRYVQREDGCMYMSHNCYHEPGADTVDDYWYNMYKNAEGKIFWCTICGRICLGHRHYTLGATKAKLELVPIQADADPFAKDCTNEGGGGLREKMTRFTAFRELAYELQKEVGKIPRKKALGELVQEMWSAPISRLSLRRAKNNLETKKFRLPANTFPNPVASNNAPNIVRNARNAELLPTVASGYNAISTTDDEKVIQFHHRQQDGEINHHEDPNKERIGADSFQGYIQSNLSDGIAGPCWLKACTAKIHPDEIKELVRLGNFPEDLYKRYKDAFNRLQRGGGQNILQEAKTAECVVWNTKKSNRKTRRNRRKGRKTRRYIR